MAQYRAIFKSAYLKGLATTLVVTAGLATGASADAATITLPNEDTIQITSSKYADDDIVIDDKVYFNGIGTADGNTAAAGSITINQGGTLKGYFDDRPDFLVVTNGITLNGGTLIINNDWVRGDTDFTGEPSSALVDRGGSVIQISGGLLQVSSATLGESTEVTIGGHTKAIRDYTHDTGSGGWNTASASLQVSNSGDGSMVINGANITIEDDGLLSFSPDGANSKFVMNSGNITLAGSELARRASGATVYDITNDDVGAAIVNITSKPGEFRGGTVTVNAGDVGQVHGNDLRFMGTTFENSGTLQIGSRLTINETLSSAGTTYMVDGAINNNGTLLLGSAMSYDGKTLVSDSGSFHLSGGTITNAADATINIYSKVNMTGAEIDNQGNLVVKSGATFNVNEIKSTTVDGVVTVAGTVQNDGLITVEHGTLDLTSATSITSDAAASTVRSPQGAIYVGVTQGDGETKDAVLKITEAQAHDYLNTFGKTSTNQTDTAGAIVVAKGNTVDFGDTVTLSDFKFVESTSSNLDKALAGAFYVYDSTSSSYATQSGANFKATTMTLEDALLRNEDGDVQELDATNVIADNLNLHYAGKDTVKDFEGNFSFEKATVGSNLDVAYTGSDSKLKITEDIELAAYTPAVVENNKTIPAVAKDGTITGQDFILVNNGDNGSIDVSHGHWTATPNITLTSGASINVYTDLNEEGNTDANTTDSSLALNGSVTFDLESGNSELTVKGHGYNPLLDDAATGKFSATLDLTGGLAVINDTDNHTGEIKASSGGIVTLNSDDINAIIKVDPSDTSKLDKLSLYAASHGAIHTTGNVTADFTDFKSGDSGSAGTITLKDGAFIAESLYLTGNSTTEADTTLNTNGSIYVDSLSLNDEKNDLNDSYNNQDTLVTLGADSEVYVAESLNTDAANLVVNGLLDLGAEDVVEGSILANKITVNEKGTVRFTNSTWNAITSDFVVDGGSLEVGNTRNDVAANLSGNKLTVTGADSVRVYDNGTASFNSIDVADADAGAITVQGNMTIAGVSGDMDDDNKVEDHHGVYFGDTTRGNDGIFYVDGIGATLEFGSTATLAFYNSENQTESNGVKADAEGKISKVYIESVAQNSLTVHDGGTVKLNLADTITFNKDQLSSLRSQLFTGESKNGALLDGYLDIGNAKISDVVVTDDRIDWADLADISDIVWVTNDDLKSATVYNVDSSSKLGGSYGAFETTNTTDTVQIVHNTELRDAAGNQGNFIGTAEGKAVSANVYQSQILRLIGPGNINSIRLQNGTADDQTIAALEATESGDAITVLGNITGNQDGETAVEFSGLGTTTVKGTISLTEVNVMGNVIAENDVSSRELYVRGGSLQALKNVSTNEFDAKAGSTVTVDGNMSLGSASTRGFAVVEDNSTVSIKGDFTVNGGFIRVGSDDISATEITDNAGVYDGYYDSADETEDGLASNTASTGYFEVLGETRLNGATVYVDPSYGMNTSLNTYMTFAGSNTNRGQLGTLDGNIVVGKNAAVGFGLTNAELAAKIAQYQTEGSLSENNYGSILYINGQLNVADGAYIALNSNSSHKTVEQIRAEFGSSTNGSATADLSLGNNTALIISDSAVQAAAADTTGSHNAAVKFNKTGATIYAQSDAEVLLDGTTFSLNSINLFADADGTVTLITEDGNGLDVGTVSGLFEAVLKDGETGSVTLQITREGLENTVLSNPVRQSLYDVLEEPVTPPTEGEGSGEGTGSGAEGGAEGGAGAAGEKQQATRATTVQNRYAIAQGSFIATALAEQASLQSLEQAARLGVYAGAAQAALGATSTTTDAIAGRMGVGAPNGSVTFADNGQGAALWVTPVYKNHDSDGFDAECADYGVDMDLYGVALGADYTLANGLRIGAMFNVGSGEADGAGVGSGVSNDFDYYGFAVYGGYTYGALSIIGDISYTAVDNDFEANTGLTNYGKLESSSDSDALSFGVTGQYAFDMQSVTVTPHIGLRFTQVELDDYTVKAGGEEVVGFNTDSMNVFSIPVGVTFASDFTAGSWTVKPSVDLTVTANAGDTELDGDSTWFGTDNGFGDKTYATSTEVLDDFTYGATVGIAAKTGGFSFGLGLNYTGSSNADEFGVNANARYVF